MRASLSSCRNQPISPQPTPRRRSRPVSVGRCRRASTRRSGACRCSCRDSCHDPPRRDRRAARGRGPAAGDPGRADRRDRRVAASSVPLRHVVIAARGTSDHAAIYAQYVLGVRNRLSVGLGTPSIVSLYGVVPDFSDALVIGISQSGASPDIVAVIAAARAQGSPTIAITNEPGFGAGRGRRPDDRARRGPGTGDRRDQDLHGRAAGDRAAVGGARRRSRPIARRWPAIPETLARALALEPDIERIAADQARRRAGARDRPRLRVRDRPRVGPQAQGARPGLRRSVLVRRLPARAAGPGRGRRPGPRGRSRGRARGRPRRAARAGCAPISTRR